MGLQSREGLTKGLRHDDLQAREKTVASTLLGRLGRQQDTSRPAEAGSAGVGRRSDKPIGDSFGELVESLAFSTNVAADLAVVEDQ